tara:strand:+ start:54032 stop:55018 length:987 start_codon:yes stop_codon:yes gene_type:complete
MGFINTGNTNTLELNLTDYGKSILVGNSGGDLLSQIVKFGLKDSDIDYRRFSGDSKTQSYGPCYDQSSLFNNKIESLSGECFYNYPDVRGRVGVEVCNMAVLQGPDTNGSSILFNPKPSGYLWYTLNEDLEPKYCFKKGYNSTNLGLNEYGCKCSQFGLYNDEIVSDGIRPGYPTYRDVIQMYNYTKNPRNYPDDNYKVGDFTGEGDINCDDFCWVISCYGKGISEMGDTNKKFTSRMERTTTKRMLDSLSCECGGYNTNTESKDTFVCPFDKTRYKSTDKNRKKCEELGIRKRINIKSKKLTTKDNLTNKKTNTRTRTGGGSSGRRY